ncbi:NADPH:quinone oxidoreductase family protein [uncultured Cellulomonas sp.]|uniref:NADPH:quinone oxidoreductase family protein n=1 Tax=uncultured Cellulomonas sp. TaxID=189682 RepID=UPI0028E232D6|nr:NADPH:quinone oxidoreductase family protein [uncultured Cellulomonas sp.]
MRAWHVVRHGEPAEVLELADVADPTPAPGQVLVAVRTVAVNFPDVLLARGEYQVRPPLPFSPGIELCGQVVAVGAGVTRASVGDRVVGSHIGVLAELAVLEEREVFPAPAALDDTEAAALTIGYQTAWFGLHRRAALQPGETLLVHAAAGGVGSAAVQLGAAAGARVIGVVGSAAKAEVARTAGADVVVDRSTQDVVAEVKAQTGGAGADVVFDPVGGSAFEQSTRCVAFEGRIVVVGFAGGTIQAVNAGHALVKNYGVLGLHWALYAQRRPELVDAAHVELTRLIDAGRIRPVVTDVVAFEDAPGAVQRLADGGTTGRLVVRVA